MYPHHFANLAKGWLTDTAHPGIPQVRTLTEVGWHEQPVGLLLGLSDGWSFVLQCVGTAPDGGNANRNPNSPAPTWPEGSWEDNPDYRAARKVFEKAQAAYSGPKSRRPQASVQALLGVVLAAVEKADHVEVASVEIPDGKQVVKVVCDDGSTVYGLAAGYLPPGGTSMAHKAHDVPADWQREVAHVS